MSINPSHSQSAATSSPTTNAPGLGSQGGLKRLALRGSAWTFISFGASHAARLGSNLILTRLLFQEAFGLMAVVSVFMQGLQMFSDVGVQPAILQNKRGDDPRFLNTAWTVQILRGFGLWLAACALAWPVGWGYGDVRLTQMLPVVGLTAVFHGFASTAIPWANRRLMLGRISAIGMSSYGISVLVMIGCAWWWGTVWALVVGGVVNASLRTLFSHFIVPGFRNRLDWDRDAARSMFRFGRWIFLSSIISFLAMQLDRLCLAGFIGMKMLGVYSIAIMLSDAPMKLNKVLARNVGLPSLSEIHRNQSERVREVFYRVRFTLDLVFLPALGVLMATGDLVVAVLYEPHWAPAGWMLQLLCLRAAMRCMLEPCEQCLVASGYPVYATIQHSVRLAWVMATIPLGWIYFGLEGVVLAVALSEVLVLPVLWFGLYRRGVLDLWREQFAWLLLLTGFALGWLPKYAFDLPALPIFNG